MNKVPGRDMALSEHSSSATPPDPAVDAAAERWLARIVGGDCTPAMRAQFERWRQQPGHAAAYARAERLWSDIGGLADDERLRRMADEALEATAAPLPRRRTWAMAAALAACVLLPLCWFLLAGQKAEAILATAPGQRSDFSLPDGSRLSLNVDSQVSYRFDRHQRRLHLVRGEALFDVAHDPGRPFRVTAGNGRIEALGTRFQVWRHAGRIDVTLLQGTVEVERAGIDRRVRMTPGTQATYWLAPEAADIALRRVDTEVASAWTHGRLLFRNTPLSEFIAEVNRYGGRPLFLADATLADAPISGTLPLGDSRSAAHALQTMLGLHADFSDPHRIVLARDGRNGPVRRP